METDDEGDQDTMTIKSTYDVEKQLDKMIQLGQLRKNFTCIFHSRLEKIRSLVDRFIVP